MHDDTALHSAAQNGHYRVVEILCGRFGADVHAMKDRALSMAAAWGHYEVVELLCGRFGASVHHARPFLSRF